MKYINGIPICPRFFTDCYEMECPSCCVNGCLPIRGTTYHHTEPFFDKHHVGMNYPINTMYHQIVIHRGMPGFVYKDHPFFDPRFHWAKERNYRVKKNEIVR